jgi:hypothetical protein
MSVPTIDSSRPEHDHRDRLEHRARASTTAKIRPSTISEKYSAGRTCQRELGQRRARSRDQHGRDAAGEERADRGDRERRTGAALLGHLEAVEQVTTDDVASPGMLTRIEVVEPPYCAP